MKRNSLLLATALLIGMTGCKNTPVQKEAWISNALDAASYQLKSTAEELSGTSKFPRSIHSGYDVNFLDTQLQRENKAYIDSLHPNPEALQLGQKRLCGIADWTSGFFPGSLWYAYELTSGLGYAIIDRMLGGKGETLEKTREFSEIEMSIIERIMVICMQLLREPWKNVAEINPFLERIETNPQFAQIISPSDMVALVTMNVKIGDVEGLMNVCLPFFTLESVMDRLNTKFWYSNLQKMDEEDYEQFLEVMVRKVDVPVKAVLGKSVITVNDFVNIQVGDIIRLDSKVDDEMDVYVGNIKKFTAVPGANKENYAVRVTSVIREEE